MSSNPTSSSAPTRSSGDEDYSSSVPTIDENWASPAEVLEMRTMWSAIIAQHRAETKALQAALSRAQQQEEVYLRELQDTAKLRKLYSSTRVEQQRVEADKRAWTEERILLQQQVQRLQLEREQFGSTSSEAASWRGSSSTAHQVAEAENIALHEALTRKAHEVRELEQRVRFLQTTNEASSRGLQSRIKILSSEVDIFRERARALKDSLHDAQSRCDTLERECQDAVLERERSHAQVDLQKDALTREKDRHFEEYSDMVRDMERKRDATIAALTQDHKAVLGDLNRECDELRKQKLSGGSANEVTRSKHQQELQRLRDELDEERERRQHAESELHQYSCLQGRLVEDLRHELEVVSASRQELLRERTGLISRCDETDHALILERREVQHLRSECEDIHAQMEEIRRCSEGLQEELLCSRVDACRVEELEAELCTQQDFYERHLHMHVGAMGLLQEKSSTDAKVLLDIIAEYKHAKPTTKTRTSKTSKKSPEDSTKRKHRRQSPHTTDGDLAVDAVELMRTAAATAEQCADSLSHSH